jgi:hypothetical protein
MSVCQASWIWETAEKERERERERERENQEICSLKCSSQPLLERDSTLALTIYRLLCWVLYFAETVICYDTMFDVPDPLAVHVLLLTHEFSILLCASSFLVSSVWRMFSSMKFMCPKHTNDDPPSLILCGRLILADAWWVFTVLFSGATFLLFLFFFAGATSLWRYKKHSTLFLHCSSTTYSA